MSPLLNVHLLGEFRLAVDGEPAKITSLRQQSLIAYLLVHRHAPRLRSQIAFALWPESTDAQALTNLRRELHFLRKSLTETTALLDFDGDTIQWRADGAYTADVAEFERLLTEGLSARAAGHAATATDLLQQAVEAYQGPLLPACYEEWILPIREALEQRFVQALEALADLLSAERQYAPAIRIAHRLLRHDPLMEETHRRLMQFHALNGDRARALHVYHDCCTILAQELGVDPAPETQGLYRRLLRAGEVAPAPAKRLQLVGRQREWQVLLAEYRQAAKGQARLVLIDGEAGVGKSLLAEELLYWAGQQGILTAKARAYAAQDGLAYAPVAALLRTADLAAQQSQLGDVWLTELVRVLPELREKRPDLPPPPPVTEQWRRRHLLEAMARAMLAGEEPRVLLIDDLQWCDRETLEWIHFLLRFAPEARLLLVGTVRPEEVTDDHAVTWLRLQLEQTAQLSKFELAALSPEETAALAAQVSGQRLSDDSVEQLYRQTEGNPLFVVETLRARMEEGAMEAGEDAGGHDSDSLPPKIHAVIRARLASLSQPARELASLAAAVGRSFNFPVLLAGSKRDEDGVLASLDELWRRRIIRVQGPEDYDFSHDRIREAAYDTISPIRRPRLHRRLAEALVQVHGQDLDAVAGQLAAHYAQAGRIQDAVDWHQRAAQVQQRLHANKKAIGYLQSALALLEQLPAGSSNARQEAALLLDLDTNLKISGGLAAPDRLSPLNRARELLQEIGDDEQLFWVTEALLNYHSVKSAWPIARKLDKELERIAHATQNPWLLAHVHRSMCRTAFYAGDFVKAYDKAQEIIALLASETFPETSDIGPTRRSLKIAGFAYRAWSLWVLGYPGRAPDTMDIALACAEETKEPFIYTNILFFASLLHRQCGNVDKVEQLGASMLALGERYELPMSMLSGAFCAGWVQVQRGDPAAGIPAMAKGIDGFRQMGQTLNQTPRLARLAACCLQAKKPDAAAEALQEAWSISTEAQERWWDAELHRLQGQLAQASGESSTAVEDHYRQALDLAHAQQARSLELRAATSLARFWLEQGKAEPARSLLAPIVAWFTEGFDTIDYRRATALLAEC